MRAAHSKRPAVLALALVAASHMASAARNVKPTGWLHDRYILTTFLKLRGGHDKFGKAEGFYKYLSHADISWVTHPIDVYTIETSGSHWFNDMVSVGEILGIETLQSQTSQFLDYYLDTQGEDGWLGPEVNSSDPRVLASRLPFLLGAIHVAEAQPDRATRIASALHRFATHVHGLLRRGEGIEESSWAYVGDLLRVLQWLYEFHPDGRGDVLAETMRMLELKSDATQRAQTFNLPDMNPGNGMFYPGMPDPGIKFRNMNAVKGILALGAKYRLTGDLSARDAIDSTWNALVERHGYPTGTYTPDLLGPWAWYMEKSELLHFTVEAMRSVSYLYQVSGNPKYADQVERMVYNAFWSLSRRPSAMWGAQSSMRLCRGYYPEDGPYHGIFSNREAWGGDDSCTVHLYPEGWPDFIHNAFQTTRNRTALVHVYPGPFSVNTKLAEDNEISITVNTTYPFDSDTLVTTIVAEKDFKYFIRIPEWSTSNATVSINGGPIVPCTPINGLHAISVNAGTTNITLHIPSEIVVENLPNGRVIVRRGSLLYAYDEIAHVPAGTSLPTERDPRYGINTTSLHLTPVRSRWSCEKPTMKRAINAAACPVGWNVWGDSSGEPADPRNARCDGPVTNLTLTVYAVSLTSIFCG
ncbi:hypothetical protein BC628DRAFT_1341106 [Trametes gibbosa]|nr:hypothetical protein BC628DRAFT_1341106 [Trametes gibbosa]